jgi:hypothetical protein
MTDVMGPLHRHADGAEGHGPVGHDHDHDHGHSHAHDPHAAGEGPTVLDIGGDIGALILHTAAELEGAEIEISPVGQPDKRRHVAVHARQLPGGRTIYAAMYYSLMTGSYDLWAADGSPALTVEITGGEIAECEWPDSVAATF